MGNKQSYTTNSEETVSHDIKNSNELLQRSLNCEDNSFERYMLIWLDKKSNDNTLDTLRTKTLLRQLNNNRCLFYNDVNIFLNEYEQLLVAKEKILLIISGSFAEQILPQISNIPTIIIFCSNYKKYHHLLHKKYRNLCDICVEHELLKASIQREIPSLKFNLFDNQMLKTMRPLDQILASEDFTNSSAYFSYVCFIDILKQMPKTAQAMEIMIRKCLDYYRNDKTSKILDSIKEFRNTYSADKALDWYTQDTFVYKLINQAFRTEDITLWYLFRFYIVDLCEQLEDIHKKQNLSTILTLYRGQTHLPIAEFEYIKANIGALIAINGFLSTSKDVNIAKQFILGAEDSNKFKVVLFEITVDPCNLKNSIFVDIDMFTGKKGEEEILFDIGSVFKIEGIYFDEDFNIWIIKMKATDERTDQIREQLKSTRQKFKTGNINMLFGRLLLDMGHYSKAEAYFQLMLQVLPNDHDDLPLVYDHIGDLHMRITNWNEAFRNFNRSYELKKNSATDCNHPCLAISLNNIGNYFSAINKFDEALEFYRKALKCKNNQVNNAITYLNISSVYVKKGNYVEALDLCTEVRDQLQQIKPNSIVETIYCQCIIGDAYVNKREFNDAEGFYLTGLLLAKKHLPIGNLHQINCTKLLVELYVKQDDIQRALNFCCEELSIYSQYLPIDHPSIAHLLIVKGKLYRDNNPEQIQCYEKALYILEKNIHYEYESTANCLMLMGQYYDCREMYEKSIDNYRRAIEIQIKIYPADHAILLKTQNLIQLVEIKYANNIN